RLGLASVHRNARNDPLYGPAPRCGSGGRSQVGQSRLALSGRGAARGPVRNDGLRFCRLSGAGGGARVRPESRRTSVRLRGVSLPKLQMSLRPAGASRGAAMCLVTRVSRETFEIRFRSTQSFAEQPLDRLVFADPEIVVAIGPERPLQTVRVEERDNVGKPFEAAFFGRKASLEGAAPNEHGSVMRAAKLELAL